MPRTVRRRRHEPQAALRCGGLRRIRRRADVRAAFCAAVLGHARQLHRPLQHRGAGPGPPHRRRRADIVRAGRVRRHRRLHDGDPVHAIRAVAVVEPRGRGRAHDSAGAVPRLHHAAHARPLPAAGDDRLGDQPLFSVRQSGISRRAHRDHRHSRAEDRRRRIAQRALFLFPDLGHHAGGAVGDRQSARFASRARHTGAARPAGDGGGVRGRRRAAQDHRVRLRRGAGVRFGMAVRPPSAVRESDAVRPQSRHRIPFHGGSGRRRQRLGCGDRRIARHAGEGTSAGHPAVDPGAIGQFRDRRIRNAHGDTPAIRARRHLAAHRACIAAAHAARRSPTPKDCPCARHRRRERRCSR